MKWALLRNINKLWFGYEDIARALNISLDSARVSASRYCAQNILIRLKRNLYILRENWSKLTKDDFFQVSNLLQTPSYVSFTTALEYYGITTQLQSGFIEAAAIKRTRMYEIDRNIFNFTKIAENKFFGFEKINGFFIAKPEKAFADALYLSSLGRYSIDMEAIEFSLMNIKKISEILEYFPRQTRVLWNKYGRTATA